MHTITWGNVKRIERDEARALIMEKVSPEPNTGCWLWMGPIDSTRYGKFHFNGPRGPRTKLAHRLSYEAFKGPLGTLTVDHLCRVKPCVNPDHLEAVTQEENYRRYVRAGAFKKAVCKHGHPMTGDNVATSIRKGRNARRCRACGRHHNRLAAARLKARKEATQ